MNPGYGWLRLLRGALLAACCLVLGWSGHALGGASFNATAPVLAAAVLIAAGSVGLAGRQCGFGRVLGAAAWSQLVFHLTLSVSPPPAAGHAGHGAVTGLDVRMLLGHVAGAVLMAAVLAYGDAAAWGLYRSLRRFVVPRVVGQVVVVDRTGQVPAHLLERVGLGAAGLLLVAATPHRGPPRVAAA